MAVDANVLILERVKEEVRLGRSAISALEAGYREAQSTIIDANLTTLISTLFLFQFGSGTIKGFAGHVKSWDRHVGFHGSDRYPFTHIDLGEARPAQSPASIGYRNV